MALSLSDCIFFCVLYQKYKNEGRDTIILAGAEYGSGSSRDWAAKGPMLLVRSWLICFFPSLTNSIFYMVLKCITTTGSESCDLKEF